METSYDVEQPEQSSDPARAGTTDFSSPGGGTDPGLREAVRERYAQAAREAARSEESSCCSGTVSCKGPISEDLYAEADVAGLPASAVLASIGCGNPAALAELNPGEVVLDLGSGGGIDVLLSARRVGPRGKAYGLDMTDEMLELARRNQREAGIANAEFLQGHIEDIPLPDGSVDVVISNCVINLSTEKDRVLAEAFRVLRPGGRLAVADIVAQGYIPDEIRRNIELWSACQAGALHEDEYREKLEAVGFTGIEVEITRVYGEDELTELNEHLSEASEAALAHGRFCSAFIRARKAN